MGLQEDAVDVVDVHGFIGGSNGFDEAADAEIAGFTQDAVGGADDEIDGGLRKSIVAESDAIEFPEKEVAQ
ncbi:hypothetical protein KIH39_15385 [Telmatocola sphagniphila]|uniref:Uncharacterized protein n=1 Tax=Telmatocola sphagniphila TaxID=1123043 RepID=A0A8E6ETL0_9BACT|nr:hypothetical protein [Telmatocola sphagniphila]QVL30235.1 hypothetical protein KIH39_15385 [Telmatocola sphagniphila]